MPDQEPIEERVARAIYESFYWDTWAECPDYKRESYLQAACAVLLLLRPGKVEVRDENFRPITGEQIPAALTFSGQVTFNRLEFEQHRSPEQLIDGRLLQLKVLLLEMARDLQPPPAFFPKDDR